MAGFHYYGFQIIDISDPTSPQLVGFFGSYYMDVVVSGNYAYIAGSDQGLRVIDISNPSAPFEAGAYDSCHWVTGVAVTGSSALIADFERGLRIINVSNPTMPMQISHYFAAGRAEDVVFRGDYAYLAAGNGGMKVINVSNPAHPRPVATCYPVPTALPVYLCIALSGNYTYVGNLQQGMGIIDITNPNAPMAMGYCPIGYTCYTTQDVAVSGNYAYAVWWVEDRDQFGGLKVVDVSDPFNPFIAGSLDMPDYAMGVAVRDTLVYGSCLEDFSF